jgi:phospholipid transport system substrate-binding protein
MNRFAALHCKSGKEIVILAACMIVVASALVPTTQSAQAQIVSHQSQAETFVQTNLRTGLNALNDRDLSQRERHAQASELLTSLTDIPRIAIFALGPARGSMSAEQVREFVHAFREYSVAIFETWLNAYSGQLLRVTGCTRQAANEYLVTAIMVASPGTAAQQDKAVEVDFRVQNFGERYLLTDMAFAGVWFTLQQRDEVAHYLQDNNGNIGGLVVHLNVLTERMRRAGTAS